MRISSPVRLIAMDMDGTLLTHSDHGPAYISEGNLQALRLAHEAGIRLVIASGRAPDDASMFAVKAGLPMAILSLNGACCQTEALGDIADSCPMPCEAAARVWHRACELELEAGLFSGNHLVTTRPMDCEKAYHRWGTWLTSPETRCVVQDLNRGAEERLRDVPHKIVLLSEDRPWLLTGIKEDLEKNEPELEVTSSWACNLEVNARGVNKGTALERLAARFGIPMAQVMAIGDNGNDIPMLEKAGYGVAMGNATKATVEASRYITRSVTEDGVAAAIRALALGLPEEGVRAL